MSEQITYLYTEKSRGTIVISSMRTFTDLESLKKHWEKNAHYHWFIYKFVGNGEPTLLTEKKLKELFK